MFTRFAVFVSNDNKDVVFVSEAADIKLYLVVYDYHFVQWLDIDSTSGDTYFRATRK